MGGFKRIVLMMGCVLVAISWSFAAKAADYPHELVYSDGNIQKVDIDSGVVTQLTDLDAYSTNPAWSHDGQRIAFISTLSGFYERYALYVMNADGSFPIKIASDLLWRSEPVWLSDDQTILYATGSATQDGDCILMSVQSNGADAHELLREDHSQCYPEYFNPSLSPDEKSAILEFYDQPNGKYFQLYKLDLVTGKLIQLTHDRSSKSSPVWSPDGTQIAFSATQDKQRELFVMDADGGNVRQLTHRPGNDDAPRWTPDGEHLIFVSDQDHYNLYNLDINTGVVHHLTNLTDSGAWNHVLSPDGTQMIYSVGRDPVSGPEHTEVMMLATDDVHELSNVTNAYGFAWRP